MLIALQFEIDNFIDYTNGEALLFQPVFLIQLRLKTNFFSNFQIRFKSCFGHLRALSGTGQKFAELSRPVHIPSNKVKILK